MITLKQLLSLSDLRSLQGLSPLRSRILRQDGTKLHPGAVMEAQEILNHDNSRDRTKL
jgi:hypothetical protein